MFFHVPSGQSPKDMVIETIPAQPTQGAAVRIKAITTQTSQSTAAREEHPFVKGIALKTAPSKQGAPVVQHFIISENIDLPTPLPDPFMKVVKLSAREQEENIQSYSQEIDQRILFYVIRKETIQEKPGFIVSYVWGTYRNDLVMNMYLRLVLMMGVLFVLIWPLSLWLARYLSRPLVQMESHIARIAEKDWDEPLSIDRKDEIGKLARSFENMRRQLIQRDKTQQTFLQNVSHGLKTPLMVIRSYTQSILDGIYPKGTLDESIKVINSEAAHLEKRVQSLLYLTKLKYVSTREKRSDDFDIAGVITEQIERHKFHRNDLQWDMQIIPATIYGDREQWKVAVENLLDNQVRHAESMIKITLNAEEGTGRGVLLRICNDGPPVSQELLDSIFEPYKTGDGGNFGLGLAIVKQVADSHQALVWAANEQGGPAFYIKLKTEKI